MTELQPNTVAPSWFLRFSAFRILFLFAFHAAAFTISYLLAWLVRFEFEVPFQFAPLMISTLPFVVGTQLIVGALFGFYRGWWRYVGLADVIRLVVGTTTSLIVLIVVWYLGETIGLVDRWVKVPRGVLLVDWAFALLTLFGARVTIRIGRDRVRSEQLRPFKRVIIVGAGDAGETLARELEHRPQLGMKVVCFVDDHPGKLGSQIRGIQVLGPIAEIARIADQSGAEQALIAIPSASGDRMRQIVHHLADANLTFKTIPGIDQLVTGRVHVSQLRPVNLEDLIRRQKIELPGDPVRALIRNKRILITGAGGTIGSELAVQVLRLGPAALHLLDRSEYLLYEVDKRLSRETAWMTGAVHRHLLDIRDDEGLADLLEDVRPQVVLHAAAHKHVPLGEENPAEYFRNNTLATIALAQCCERVGVDRFVFISTDKAINPTSVMGASKRAAEILLMDLARSSQMKVTAVRFGNVLGSSGSVVPLFLEQIAEGGPVTVTHPDVTRYFIRPSEAISLVLQAAVLGKENHGCVMMLDMGEPIRILELAQHVIELSGLDDIEIAFIGLRPGEKLFEEVNLDGESFETTAHPQILITKAPQPESAMVRDWLAGGPNDCQHAARVRALLSELVPEFTAREDDRLVRKALAGRTSQSKPALATPSRAV